MKNLYNIKVIKTKDEYNDVWELWSSRSKVMRHKQSFPFLKDIDYGTIVGAYQDNSLVGTLKYTKWKGLPFYSMGSLFIKKNLIPRYDFSNPINPLISITDFILRSLEEEEFYNWYYVRALGKAYAKIEKDDHDLLSCTELGPRYHRFVEELILPGTRSKNVLYDKMAGSNFWDNPIMIVKCSLDNQYRKHGDVFKTELNFLNAKKNTTTH